MPDKGKTRAPRRNAQPWNTGTAGAAARNETLRASEHPGRAPHGDELRRAARSRAQVPRPRPPSRRTPAPHRRPRSPRRLRHPHRAARAAALAGERERSTAGRFARQDRGGHYDETFAEIGEAERRRRFGQGDHVRRFGAADRERHLGKLLRLPEDYDASALFGRAALERARIPEAQWRGFTIATVLDLARQDMPLLGAR